MATSSHDEHIGTIVVGGGQSGLATSYYLKRLGVSHVVLDENQHSGASWRRRWESLRLFTPARYDSLPGLPFPGPLNRLPGKDDIADYLGEYALRFDLPVRSDVRVTRILKRDFQFLVETSSESVLATNVVVATGAFSNPRIPDFAETLDPSIRQMHSSSYQNPAQVPAGAVLVVGAGQSGAEIALDLAKDHEVWLSGSDPGEEPGQPGSITDRLFTPIMVFAARNVINVANPLGRKVRDHFLHPPRGIPRAGGTKKRILDSGIRWVGRTTGTVQGRPQLEDGRELEVSTVIWCTGFSPNYSWIEMPVFDEYGYPIHSRGVVEDAPGLYFMGLPFQRTLSSALIMGAGTDAEYIANHIGKRIARAA